MQIIIGGLNLDYKRIFIEKKQGYSGEASILLNEFREYLGLDSLKTLRIVNLYDFIGSKESELEQIVEKILYEPVLDKIYYDKLRLEEGEMAFRVEYLKGQFNQREESLRELVRLVTRNEEIVALQSKIIVVKGVNNEDFQRIKDYYINPIEMVEVDIDSFHYQREEDQDQDPIYIGGFIDMDDQGLEGVRKDYGIVMDLEDMAFTRDYFKEEGRDPSLLELKLIDTYWSDHCRHTTFMSEITDIKIDEGFYKEIFEEALEEYLASREFVYGQNSRPISLMDMGTINMKEVAKKGLLDDKEKSKEINAASIEVDVKVDGRLERWLLMFKNETHNHPTEMEPFGGAGTCLGGAIRDPLSGRSYVYQGMRISGSADPRTPFDETLEGKLPQRKITRGAMEGFSAYGYGIGSPTGYVREVYDPGYMAKRMEVGALVAAVPKENVYRGEAEAGDIILLVGGRTGRDGLGGAVGSSKEHTEESMDVSGAEVQKGNPMEERKILRLFRKKEVSRMIKICNDFGAGGISVAIGELADGLIVDLDKVPTKYDGLLDWELGLSESQERMAVVIAREDLEDFMAYAEEEDVEATLVADVTEEKSLVMKWRSKKVVDIKRSFLDSNGIRKKARVRLGQPEENSPIFKDLDLDQAKLVDIFKDLNVTSQKGLIESFDSSVGRGNVIANLGGKRGLTPADGMLSKLPVLNGETTTCSIMTHGFDPEISKWSPFHGGYYSVIDSLARLVALGGDYKKARLSLQEYFERIGEDELKWGKPFSGLLGAFSVQKSLDVPSIGGKDSMSGSFEDIDVPPTIISFAVTTEEIENIVSQEFKETSSKVVLVKTPIDKRGLVSMEDLEANFQLVKKLGREEKLRSAMSVKYMGVIRSIGEMALGNRIGFSFEKGILEDLSLTDSLYGSIILELEDGVDPKNLGDKVIYLGHTQPRESLDLEGISLDLGDLERSYTGVLDEVFPIIKNKKEEDVKAYTKGQVLRPSLSLSKPKVLIPILKGSHGEYDMEMAFRKEGARVKPLVLKTRLLKDFDSSLKEIAEEIRKTNILAFPDGFLMGNEPETSGKFLNIFLNNPYIKESIEDLLENKDGLILGVGSGFSGLLKSGLIENSSIGSTNEDSSYLADNLDGGFLSRLVELEVKSNLSPWLSSHKPGDRYLSALGTKEGRIIGRNLEDLVENGQLAVSFVENPTGSSLSIEALTSKDGRVLGTITGIDRISEDLYKNIDGNKKIKIFESGVNYFR